MKQKIIDLSLCISIFIIVILSVYTIKVQPVCERRHVDDINRNNPFMDEEMARELANIVMEIDEDTGEKADTEYKIDVTFDDKSYEWVVAYTTTIPHEGDTESTEKVVRIRKDNGIITVYDK